MWTICTILVSAVACDDGDDSGDVQAVPDAEIMATEMDMGTETASDMEMMPPGNADMGLPDLGAPDMEAMPSEAVILRATEDYERDVEFDWIAAGQPTEARLTEVVEAGVPVISLRYPEEDPFDEPGLVEGLGGSFTRYPTSGNDYRDVAFREGMYDLYEALIDAGGTVYLHCASSNRVGASWAFFHAERLGFDVDAALEVGRAAGMRSLESLVVEILEAE